MARSGPSNRPRLAAAALCAFIVSGCVSGQPGLVQRRSSGESAERPPNFVAAIASSRRVGPGASFRPPARSREVKLALPVDGLRCGTRQAVDTLAHVELFAANHVVVVPAGIGVAPPVRLRDGRIVGQRCSYPLRTLEPTGLLLMGRAHRYTLGELFDLWGQQLSGSVMAGFSAGKHDRVAVFIDGVPWTGSPGQAPLGPGSQITVELGPHVPPHAGYLFPPLASLRS
jgi:hypothetical protein